MLKKPYQNVSILTKKCANYKKPQNFRNRKVTISDTMIPIVITFIDKSFCVRIVLLSTASPFPFNSFAAKPTAPLMIPQELMMPITPAVAIPPIPMWRARW